MRTKLVAVPLSAAMAAILSSAVLAAPASADDHYWACAWVDPPVDLGVCIGPPIDRP